MGPVPLGGSYEGGKVFTCSETPSLVEMGKLQNLRRECGSRCTEGKVERILHRDQCLQHPRPQPEMPVYVPAEMGGGWMLRLGFRSQTPGRGLL